LIQAKLIWPPYPFEAGFCITDDTDAATFKQTQTVYDYLMSKSVVTSKTVWPFKPNEACGIPATPASTLRGVTLENTEYLNYCKELDKEGYEICLHGASAGNNSRQKTENAFTLMNQNFVPSDTFICHSKNAENMYWEDKTTSTFPFNLILKSYSKHSCSGELPTSKYYWGDICKSRINQIRLFKTRHMNTLKRNPSMPYYDVNKPMVNSWFSATKRSISDCTTNEVLEKLKEENGLVVLYQYLFRYAQPESLKLNESFIEAINRLTSDYKILNTTVSYMMRRLRNISGVFIAYKGKSFWVINASNDDIHNLQIVTDQIADIEFKWNVVKSTDHTIIIKTLPKNSIKFIRSNKEIAFNNKNAIRINRNNCIVHRLPLGKLILNLSDAAWESKEYGFIEPKSFIVETLISGSGNPIFSTLSKQEELLLLTDQVWLIMREILLRRRSLDTNKYLNDSSEILLENHDNW